MIPNKGAVIDVEYKTIDHPQTRSPNPRKSGPSGTGAQVLRITFTDGAEEYTHDLPNPGFDIENPSLQFLAFCNARPSDLEAAREAIVALVPAEGPGMDGKGIAAPVLDVGKERLAESVWGPDPPEDPDEEEEQA